MLYMKIETMTLTELLIAKDSINEQIRAIRHNLVEEQVYLVNNLLMQLAEAVNELERRVTDYNSTLPIYEEPMELTQSIKRLNGDQVIRIIF